ncbi:MAG: hypothetical protein K9G36_00610 [Crocinitomicaceae bacterium]|nr:hypothetical protein [Crocinitomicaceae bacterium]
MNQDDYFLKQIDLLGKILGKILANLLNLKSQGEVKELMEITSQSLRSELDLDLNELINISNTELVNFLQEVKIYTNEHLEKIAEIFYELGFVIDNEFKNNVLEKSLTLFEYLNHTSLTYSHDRITKMEKIRALLNQ